MKISALTLLLFLPQVHLRRLGAGPHSPGLYHRQLKNRVTKHKENPEEVVVGVDSSRKLQCDAAFTGCLSSVECVMFFKAMQTEGIDWVSLPSTTSCLEVTKLLFDNGHCTQLQNDQAAIDLFCNTFDNCVNGKDGDAFNLTVDCNALVECKWEGMHEAWVGDGICHHDIGCYNHEICKFDGGDCCNDTCNDSGSGYKRCDPGRFACKDPNSTVCDLSLTNSCSQRSDTEPRIECGLNKGLYRIVTTASFGGGWIGTQLTITPKDEASKDVIQISLADGHEGTQYVCLSASSACYNAVANTGIWGNVVAWKIIPATRPLPVIASGGSPMDCEFGVGGDGACLQTCNGASHDNNDNASPGYKTYNDMYKCISEKCAIQLGICNGDSDEVCRQCLTQDIPDFCFANEKFQALVECSICSCSSEEGKKSKYCDLKPIPGALASVNSEDTVNAPPGPCSASEILSGSNALIAFSKCADFEELGDLITNFHDHNFDSLDAFVSCAASYKTGRLQEGTNALSCIQILTKTLDKSSPGHDYSSGTPGSAASTALVEKVYSNANGICDCASQADNDCPLCPSFYNFKTILFESVHACTSLNLIICDAWNEFYSSCKINIHKDFSTVNFGDKVQCEYVANGCGGAGPFPFIRKFDCVSSDIPKEALDFYEQYNNSCSLDDIGSTEGSNPGTTSSPVSQPTSPQSVEKKSDAPTNDEGDSGKQSSEEKKRPYVSGGDTKEKKRRTGWFWFFLFLFVGGSVAYYWQKLQGRKLEYRRYRRVRNDDDFAISSLQMGSGSTYFEPPTVLPSDLVPPST